MHTKVLDAESIKQHINQQSILSVQVFDTVESTNQWALHHAICGEACLAEQQTAGRGRRGRVWHSPQQGNLYLSLKWCVDEVPKHFGLLSLFVGVVIAECLQKEGLRGHGLKWPNDILWQGKKLGGILLESKGNLKEVVIGIGLNVAMQPSETIDQPWVSLDQILDYKVDRNVLAGRLLSDLACRLLRFHQLDFEEFNREWQVWDLLKGQQVIASHDDKKIEGQVAGIDQQGMLELCLHDGSGQKLLAADVSIRKSIEVDN